MSGAGGLIARAARILAQAGVDTPELDAELLLAFAVGTDRTGLVTDPPHHAPAGFQQLIERRAGREPVAYIVGAKGFRHIELTVDRRVLIPRPDTETLVEVALELPAGASVHDVGTGSGAVALALAQERPDLAVSGSDASADAVEVARANARRLGLAVPFEVARGLPPGEFDLVVANLPYVREDEWAGLEPELTRWEPREALVSGADGLDAIRQLVAQAPGGTRMALEHAPAQAASVRSLLRDAHTVSDLAARERVTVGTAP